MTTIYQMDYLIALSKSSAACRGCSRPTSKRRNNCHQFCNKQCFLHLIIAISSTPLARNFVISLKTPRTNSNNTSRVFIGRMETKSSFPLFISLNVEPIGESPTSCDDLPLGNDIAIVNRQIALPRWNHDRYPPFRRLKIIDLNWSRQTRSANPLSKNH